jgi:hypothetical protein
MTPSILRLSVLIRPVTVPRVPQARDFHVRPLSTFMAEIKITADEVQALRAMLSCLVLRDRTGELGLLHGLDRFVSSKRVFTKPERAIIQSVAKKLGLSSGLPLDRG